MEHTDGDSTPRSWIDLLPSKESADHAFEILASPRRRHVLSALYTTDEPMTVAELAEDVRRREREKRERTDVSDSFPEPSRKRIRVSLHHGHLPKLAEMGVLEYDSDRRIVSVGSDTSIESALKTAVA